jgi:predicted DNA-binding transcriptional regulator AlpA
LPAAHSLTPTTQPADAGFFTSEDYKMTSTDIIQRLDSLTAAFVVMAKASGARLTRAEVCERLGVHRNTLTNYIADKEFPTPCRDGKWLLAEVVEWEALR